MRPTVLTLRTFLRLYANERAGGRAFIPTVKPINYRASTTTLCFAAPGDLPARNRAGRPDNGYERNQFAICCTGAGGGTLKSAFYVSRAAAGHSRDGGWLGDATSRTTRKGRNDARESRAGKKRDRTRDKNGGRRKEEKEETPQLQRSFRAPSVGGGASGE